MWKKLIAVVGVGLLLAGCSAPATSGGPTATPSAPKETPSSEPEAANFCDEFEERRTEYQEALDGQDGVPVSDLASFRSWSDSLKLNAPVEVAEDVAAFTAPIYMTESGTVDLLGLFNAGNSIAQNCILNG